MQTNGYGMTLQDAKELTAEIRERADELRKEAERGRMRGTNGLKGRIGLREAARELDKLADELIGAYLDRVIQRASGTGDPDDG